MVNYYNMYRYSFFSGLTLKPWEFKVSVKPNFIMHAEIFKDIYIFIFAIKDGIS